MKPAPPLSACQEKKLEHITKAYVDTWKSVIVKITPKHITTFDYTKDETWQNFAKTYLQEYRGKRV